MATSPTVPSPLITLTTDFGDTDHYVPSMKGVILSLNRSVRIVDISHQIRPQGIVEGGFVLACAFPTFPPGTIHVLVVDPGVGTMRRLLLARTENHIFLAPDNGALGLVFDVEPAREVHAITASHYFRKEVSATFHGRDILSPVAAWVARGTALSHFGPRVEDWVPSPVPSPEPGEDGRVRIQVLHVDRFGNVVFNVRRASYESLRQHSGGGAFALEMGGRRITDLLSTYGESTTGDPFALFNSCGYLEVAIRDGSAAVVLSAAPGQAALLSV